MAVILNASTSSGFVQSADTSGEINIQSNGTTRLSVLPTGVSGTLVQGTAVASTSGTSIDFTSIPNWVKRITVLFQGVSTNGTSQVQIQIGAGSVTTSGYLGSAAYGTTSTNFNSGFLLADNSSVGSTYVRHGTITINLLENNTWCESSLIGLSNTIGVFIGAGSIALGGTLDRVRITTVNGTDTFDAGSINIQYEG